MTQFFEQIKKHNLLKKNKVNTDVVVKMSVFDIIEFAQESKEITLYRDNYLTSELFTHAASESISASSWPCESIECRLEKSNNLAQFAAFYSDKVYIPNFITKHLIHLDSTAYPNEDIMRQRLLADLIVLQFLKPVIEEGKIVPVSFDSCCPKCFVNKMLHGESEKILKKVLSALSLRYSNEINYSVYCDDQGIYNMRMTGPEELLEHGYLAYLDTNPFPCITHDHKIQKAVKQGKEVKISRSWIEKMGIDIWLTDKPFQNAIFGLRSAQLMNSHFVTNRSLDISLANDITTDRRIRQRNSIIQDHLTSLVPFIRNISPSEILKIRKKEEDSFIRFRQALNKAINECKTINPNSFSKQDASAIYQDVLRPELSRLHQISKNAHSTLIKKTLRTAISYTAGITFGFLTGLLPKDMAVAAKALGITKIISDLTNDALSAKDATKDIQASPMYFLWEIKKEVT
ncbi:MAG: hypothetical protein GF353_18825 [Candidatus Lokiarchaeota archaeon]|nr:hypothetical protein [Candidatus Lokiarchaeota archaeon]